MGNRVDPISLSCLNPGNWTVNQNVDYFDALRTIGGADFNRLQSQRAGLFQLFV